MIKQFTFNHFDVNTYLIVDEATRLCAIVDPATEASFEDAQLTQYIEAEHLQVAHILLTHAHVDHIAGLRQCCEQYGLPVSLHPDGLSLLRQVEAYGSLMGFEVEDMRDLPVRKLYHADIISLGQTTIECRYTPGHCPGSLSYVLPEEKAVFTGDALFCGSIGRTDLPGGNYRQLIESIQNQLLTLPDDYRVLPGHGSTSTIGYERQYNGFLV